MSRRGRTFWPFRASIRCRCSQRKHGNRLLTCAAVIVEPHVSSRGRSPLACTLARTVTNKLVMNRALLVSLPGRRVGGGGTPFPRLTHRLSWPLQATRARENCSSLRDALISVRRCRYGHTRLARRRGHRGVLAYSPCQALHSGRPSGFDRSPPKRERARLSPRPFNEPSTKTSSFRAA